MFGALFSDGDLIDQELKDLFDDLDLSDPSKCTSILRSFNIGESYQGQFFDDKPHGFGAYIYDNRSLYIGYFIGGRRSGHGTLYFFENPDDYRTQNGIWEDDIFIVAIAS